MTSRSEETEATAAALRLCIGRIARRLRQAKSAVGDVSLAEASVLARLHADGPQFPGALAELEGVRPQAMAATVAALEDRGLVSRWPDERDGRRAVICATDSGRAMVSARQSESVRLLAEALDGAFTPDERRAIAAGLPLLERLAEALG